MIDPAHGPRERTSESSDQPATTPPSPAATLTARGILYRRLAIEAPGSILLEFNGRGLTDRVLVDHRVVASRFSWWRITPQLAFTLPVGDQRIAGLVEIRVWPWFLMRGFRVTLAQRIVYAEGCLSQPCS